MRPVTEISILGVRLGIVVLAVYWSVMFVATHLPLVGGTRPKSMPVFLFQVNDKVIHVSAFFVLGALMCYVTNSPRWFKRFATIGMVGMVYAAVDEVTQHFVPGRYPDPMDFVADTAGLWAAIAIYMLAKLAYETLKRPSL